MSGTASDSSRWFSSYLLSLGGHAAAVGCLQIALTTPAELLTHQVGQATIDLVASIDSTRESADDPSTLIDEITNDSPQPTEPVEIKPLEPQLKPPTKRELLVVEVAEIRNQATDAKIAPEVEISEPQRTTPPEQVTAPTTPPRARRPAEIPKELAQVDSVASPTSRGIEGAEVDDPPVAQITNPTPQYPPSALAQGAQGVVMLRVTISAAGTVADLAIDQTSGYSTLDDSALATVRRWRFQPARRAGFAVETTVLVPVRFTIRGG